jgi:DNA replication protein DnaC
MSRYPADKPGCSHDEGASRAASTPKLLRDDLGPIMASLAPAFTPCDTCGGLTSGRRCFDCYRDHALLMDARERFAVMVPKEFAWARLDAPLSVVPAEIREEWASLVTRAHPLVGATRVVLLGESGAGKTSLAVAMARAWTEHHREPASIVLATDLESALLRARSGAEGDEVANAKRAHLLVLDDVGTDRDVSCNAVTQVILHRHAESKPTWITTWMTQEQVSARYGDGMARRIFERARIIDCGRTA